jgi:hypothetical protein
MFGRKNCDKSHKKDKMRGGYVTPQSVNIRGDKAYPSQVQQNLFNHGYYGKCENSQPSFLTIGVAALVARKIGARNKRKDLTRKRKEGRIIKEMM